MSKLQCVPWTESSRENQWAGCLLACPSLTSADQQIEYTYKFNWKKTGWSARCCFAYHQHELGVCLYASTCAIVQFTWWWSLMSSYVTLLFCWNLFSCDLYTFAWSIHCCSKLVFIGLFCKKQHNFLNRETALFYKWPCAGIELFW